MMSLPQCACGCGRQVGPKKGTGPAPIYATDACRVRAYRRRHATDEPTEVADRAAAAPVHLPEAPVDEQVARAVIEARAIGFALTRLGALARPEFAWRCTTLGEAILASLLETFGEVTT